MEKIGCNKESRLFTLDSVGFYYLQKTELIYSSLPKIPTHEGNFNLSASGAACTLLSHVASSGGSVYGMVVM